MVKGCLFVKKKIPLYVDYRFHSAVGPAACGFRRRYQYQAEGWPFSSPITRRVCTKALFRSDSTASAEIPQTAPFQGRGSQA